MKQYKNLLQVSLMATFLMTSMATSATNRDNTITYDDGSLERSMDLRSETANFHDRKMFASMAHTRATAALSQATYVYTQHLRLYRQNVKTEMDMLETEIDMLNASVAHSITEMAMISEGTRYDIGKLKASWRDGSESRDLKKLATMYLLIRQRYVEHSEFLVSEYTKLLKARERVLVIKQGLAGKKIISEEELNDARVEKDHALTDLSLSADQLSFAREALADAQKDAQNLNR